MSYFDTISRDLTLYLHSQDADVALTPIRARLSWQPHDPVAVYVEFFTGHDTGDVEWILSRDQLFEGLTTRTGVGDVRVGPGEPGEYRISLTSPSGRADFSCRAKTIGAFLSECFDVIPAGCEFAYTDMEAELLALLEGEAA